MGRLSIPLLFLAACANKAYVVTRVTPTPRPPPETTDPNAYLEVVEGEKAIQWVTAHNQRTVARYAGDADFKARMEAVEKALNSDKTLPKVTKLGRYFYNFWKDATHTRGIWRRVTSLEQFAAAQPKWETVVDVDALAAKENIPWTWQGAECLPPAYERCLIFLSRGASDAHEMREFDTKTLAFITTGFALPEAKSRVGWKDLDTLFVATNFGEGTLTKSGYPRIVKEWKRGTALASATTLMEGDVSDISIEASRVWGSRRTHDVITRAPSFFESDTFLLEGGTPRHLELPRSAETVVWNEWALVTLRESWQVTDSLEFPAGACVAVPLDDAGAEPDGSRFVPLFLPTPTHSLQSIEALKSDIVVTSLDNLKVRVSVVTPSVKKPWPSKAITTPPMESVEIRAFDAIDSDDFWLTHSGFITPPVLEVVSRSGNRRAVKRQPALFDARNLAVNQYFATSKDGTKVPYFEVAPKSLKLTGETPTLLTAYGGFEVSLLPTYAPVAGINWLSRGGVLVVANIRGGGEYGPSWHKAAMRENRPRAYEDFAAVAENLVNRKVTNPKKLAIRGGSNGGLLMGVMLTSYPKSFGAVWSQAPLLDMRRYTKLLAGASWAEEYGNPDLPNDWEFIRKYSPYHNVQRGAPYPPVLFTTSTRDDRVHPGHARKMAALLEDSGYSTVSFWENTEGGHGGSSTNAQKAYLEALGYGFLERSLKLETGTPLTQPNPR